MSQLRVRVVNSIVWPVTVHVPVDGGKTEDENFFADFNRLDDADHMMLTTAPDKDVLRKMVKGVGVDAEHISTDRALLEEMFDVEYYRTGLFRAYKEFVAGAYAKN